jgi:predicted glycogen debranching enzyme
VESFAVHDGIPTWHYAVGDALLEQKIFMAPGANTSYLRLELLRATAAVDIELKPLVAVRDYHSHGHGPRPFRALADRSSCTVQAPGAPPFRLASSRGEYRAADAWYWNFLHREEAARGLDALEDLWVPGSFSARLEVGTPFFFTATAETGEPAAGDEVLASLLARAGGLLAALPQSAPAWVQALAIASDQFIVRRGELGGGHGGEGRTAGSTVIAGYPWFADWGRDTMIALPGLTTTLGRFDSAAGILRSWARFVDRGMLPNRFPDSGEQPEYNTADAVLWMFHALHDYFEATRDADLLRELFPTLAAIIHAHVAGTRYGIRVDPADGLLRAGEPASQLTWMDAKHGDRAFTPRIGKPVEINALWLNALDLAVRLATQVGADDEMRFCQELLNRAGAGFTRFWNEERACLYDVIDLGGGSAHDASLRPNQILAVALPYCVLPPQQMRAVVDACARDLLTSHGLRSLSARDPAYLGHYTGYAAQRDAAYHQGTAWAWLLGPFARAHYRVYGDAPLAQSFLAPMAQHLESACVGSVSELFDGDAPHIARGCFAQAWSVAEILRAWVYLARQTPQA